MHVSTRVARSVLQRRLHFSKVLSVQIVFARCASISSKHPFPFPPRTNPAPHEIFHLPHNASQDEIKTRYYELVKVYHPDASHFQHGVPTSVRNAQFRAITHAYGVLRGRNASSSSTGAGAWDYRDEVIRAELRRRSRRSRSTSSTSASSPQDESADDPQAWYTVVAFGLLGIIAAIGSVNSHMDRVERHTQSAAANLAQARAEAQVYGMERRRKIRELVRTFRDPRETLDGKGVASKEWQASLLRDETDVETALKDKRI